VHKLIIVAALCTLPTAIAAQDARTDAAIVVPAHTEMALRLDEEIASDRARVGQTVAVSVARDVIVDGAVLIPRGAPGVGAVTFRTGKGAFGKSGKLDIELRSVEVGGRSVPVVGRYHAAGDGRTGETIGTIIVGGVVAGAFVTGHNAVFEEGAPVHRVHRRGDPDRASSYSDGPVRTADAARCRVIRARSGPSVAILRDRGL
jgi:hypothetical protein